MTNGDAGSGSLLREFHQSDVLKAELDAIGKRRSAFGLNAADNVADRLVGLALSGGGIRSATFALGVLQRLAKADLLKCFDYLSTVSGGGYIGGSLTWLLSQIKGAQAIGAGFPYGVRKQRLGDDESNVLKHLRLHGRYLTPGRGITAMSLAAAILRGIVLNVLVWLPIAVLVFCLLQMLAKRIGVVAGSWLHFLANSVDGPMGRWLHKLAEHIGAEVGGYLTALAVVGAAFLVVSVVYSLFTWRPILSQAYCWRRWFERYVRWLLWTGLTLAVLGSLPFVAPWLVAVALVAGLAGAYKSFSGASGRGGAKIPIGLLAPAAAFLVLYGMALASYNLAGWSLKVVPWFPGWWFLSALAVSVLTGWVVNLNYVSIHRYYRDRLMEAFMPRTDPDGKTRAATTADRAKLSDMCIDNGPYHLVNTCVVLVGTDDQRWRVRGGDSFVLSPLYCGGTATKWVKTDDYMQRDALTLPTAVAISGAAVNPNTGSGGVGLMRGRALSLLMALLNVRLGYWVPHPNAECQQKVANHFRAAWHELSPRGYSEKRKLLQLSDGGHFENLGVYELVRRIGTDFGARIEFCDDNRIERLIPRDPDPQKVRDWDAGTDAYPVGARFAKRGHVRGAIVYPDGKQSTLILLKTTMIHELDLLTRGYKGVNRDFPDQTTADQFFDEEQCEAYRELGYEIADKMLEDTDICLQELLKAYT